MAQADYEVNTLVNRELINRDFHYAVIAFAMMGFTSTCWGPMLPWIAERSDLSISSSGLVLAGFSMLTLAGTILVQIFGPKKDLIWFIRNGIAVAFIGFIGVVAFKSSLLILLSACFAGLGYGLAGIALLQLFTRSSNASHVRMNGASAATALGLLAGPLTIGLLGADLIPLIVTSAIGVSLVATRLLTGAKWRAEKFEHSSQTRTNRIRLGVILLAVIFYSGLENSIGSWLPTIINESKGTLENGAFSSALFYLFFAIGRFFGVAISRFVQPHSLILFGISLAIIPCTVALISVDQASKALAICGLFLGPIFPNTTSWIARKTPGYPLATTVLAVSIMAGAFIFPPILGFILEAFGIRGFMFTLAALLLLATSLFLSSYKNWRD